MTETKRRVAVVTDSTAYLPTELEKAHHLYVVPLMLMLGGKTWRDGVDIDPAAFYKLLEESDEFPTTSQPSVATFKELFEQLLQEYEGIVVVLLADELSGTMDSALSAKAEMPDAPIEIIDSRGISVMLGFHVLAAARAADAGGDLQTVANAARALVGRVRMYFTVDTLEYLHRGGRIGAAAKLLASSLGIKPLLHIHNGIVTPLTKVRTRRRALNHLVELVEEQMAGQESVHLGVFDVAAAAEADVLQQRLEERLHPVEMIRTECSPVLGAHGGPGFIGVAFYAD
jgi:DegV family protein with EDD domain